MSKIRKFIHHAAGIDIGSQKVFVAIEDKPVRSFETFTSSYQELVKYLKENNVTHAAMEATGVYWLTLYDILESSGFDVYLVNPADSKKLAWKKNRCTGLPMDHGIIFQWGYCERVSCQKILLENYDAILV